MDPTEQEAIRRVLAGDPDAYRGLMARHLPAVLRMTLRVTGSQEDAEEAAQDAFLRAYRKLPSFRADASFGTWVYRIAVNSALNVVESRRRDLAWHAIRLAEQPAGDDLLHAHESTPEQALLQAEHDRERERLLACLTPMERTAFVLRHMEEQPVPVIAEALGTNANTARQTIFRAVAKLRNALTPVRASIPGTAPSARLRRETP